MLVQILHTKTLRLFLMLLLVSVFLSHPARAETLKVYFDADFTTNGPVESAIMLGLRTALMRKNGQVAGYPIEVVALDHRSNPRRSKSNISKFVRDPQAIAVFGGKQSPPYLTFGDFVNSSRALLLLPWSAAGPITRLAEGDENYIFRLSVDDEKAGPFLLRAALDAGCKNIGLLLVDTGWGRANRKRIESAMTAADAKPSNVVMVPSDAGPYVARGLVRELTNVGTDCVISVLTANVSIPALNGMHEIGADVRVFSHWGLLGSHFVDQVSHSVRESLNLQILQTCGLQLEKSGAPELAAALTAAMNFSPDIERLSDISASAGFVHAHDLGLILMAAIEQAAETNEWKDGSVGRRTAVRNALQELKSPVTGILSSYHSPFSKVTSDMRDGHEGLGSNQLCLTEFDSVGRLVALGEPRMRASE